jgi:hypothetical protein
MLHDAASFPCMAVIPRRSTIATRQVVGGGPWFEEPVEGQSRSAWPHRLEGSLTKPAGSGDD